MNECQFFYVLGAVASFGCGLSFLSLAWERLHGDDAGLGVVVVFVCAVMWPIAAAVATIAIPVWSIQSHSERKSGTDRGYCM